MENGIGNVTVYIDSGSGATYWQRLIKNAVTNWMYTGVGANKFYATYVNSSSGSKIDIYSKPTSFFGYDGWSTLAATSFRARNLSTVDPGRSDWYSADIYLHDARLRQNDISDTQATGTIIHEFGHGFGLDHNNSNPNSIMCQLKTAAGSRLVNTVQKVDNDALNRLY